MSSVWSWYVIALTLITVGGSFWLLMATSKRRVDKVEDKTTGHTWDGDVKEYNNPLPRWWFHGFILTIVFSALYLVLYPGFGAFTGTKGWSSDRQLAEEQAHYAAKAREAYARFAALSFDEMADNADAVAMGRAIFANNCTTCHGADARGSKGFPNLTDQDWLWGGAPEQIVTTITQGRQGAMPPWGPVLGPDGVKQVTAYVRSLSGLSHSADAAAAGKTRYEQICIACHGIDGKGNVALGAPNLTDDVWLYGNSEEVIAEGITRGRNGQMPPHGPILGEDAVRMVAGYVYSLSRQPQGAQAGASNGASVSSR